MNILLIEDDAGLVKLISTIVEELGFSVMSVALGTDALTHLKKQIPDMMLLDYSLPDINGKELIETLNKKQIPLPPFIITTGQGDERIAVDMMKLGAKDYLIKDILFLEKLPEVIKRVVKEIESDGKLKQANEKIAKGKKIFEDLFNNLNSGVAIYKVINDGEFGKDYIIENFNKKSLELEEKKKEEVIGKSLFDLRPNIDDFGLISEFREVWKTGIARMYPAKVYIDENYSNFYENRIFRMPNYNIVAIYDDVTARKKAEEELKVSEERLRGFMDSATDGFMLFDSELNQVDINDAALKMTQQKRKGVIGKNILQLAPDVEKSGRYDQYKEVIRSGKPIIFNDIMPQSKFGNKHVLLKAFKVGHGLGMIITDITEKINSERELKESEERFRRAITYAPYPIMIHSDGKVLQLSEEWIKQTGYTIDDIPTIKKWTLKAYGKDAVPNKEFIENLYKIDKTQYDGEWEVKIKDGSYRLWDFSTSPIGELPDGKKVVISMATDITERKQAEIDLKDSKERFELAMNATKDGLYDWDLVTNEIYYSPSWKNMLGYKEDELPNDFSIWEKLIEPEDAKKSWKMQQEVINKERDRFELEFRMKHKDGHWVDILSRAEAVFDDKDIAIRIVGTHVDISERKHEEKILDVELKMFEYAINHSEEEVLRKFLDEAEKLTNSDIGFYHYVEDDQESISLQTWSTNTLNNMCKGSGEATRHYPISKAGAWVDCVKERKPVIHNDYSSLAHKKGLPEGHAPIMRELVVPVIRGNKIKAVLGVGNKKSDYNESDVYSIQRFADVAWETVVRKQAEEDTKKSQLLLLQAEEISNQGAWEWDLVQDEWTFSENWLRIHGCRLSGITREELMTIAYPEDAPGVEKAFQDALKGETPYNIEHRIVRQNDGEVRYVRASGKIIYNDSGQRVKMCGVAQDITERKLTEDKLRESENFSIEIIESMSDGFSILDNNGVHIDVNLAFCNMTGFAKEELIGVGSPHPYWPEEEYENIQEAFVKTSQGNFESFELVFKRKNGKRFPVSVNPSQIKDEKGYVICSFATVRDITERKRVERELSDYQENLEETVQERTKELQDKNNELDRAMKVFVGRELKIRELEKRIGTMGKDK